MLAAWCAHAWGGGPWFLLFPLFWLVVILTLLFLFRRRHWSGHWHAGSGESVLAERYARGEISEEEYRRRSAVLGERPK